MPRVCAILCGVGAIPLPAKPDLPMTLTLKSKFRLSQSLLSLESGETIARSRPNTHVDDGDGSVTVDVHPAFRGFVVTHNRNHPDWVEGIGVDVNAPSPEDGWFWDCGQLCPLRTMRDWALSGMRSIKTSNLPSIALERRELGSGNIALSLPIDWVDSATHWVVLSPSGEVIDNIASNGEQALSYSPVRKRLETDCGEFFVA
jgi:hypothetical protein